MKGKKAFDSCQVDENLVSFLLSLPCLLENTPYVEGDLSPPPSPPELKEIQMTHLMTDRYQHVQIVLELAPEKIVTRPAYRLGCIRESTDHSQMFVSFGNATQGGHGEMNR